MRAPPRSVPRNVSTGSGLPVMGESAAELAEEIEGLGGAYASGSEASESEAESRDTSQHGAGGWPPGRRR